MKPLCVAPWTRLATDPQNYILPCCISKLRVAGSAQDAWNSAEFKDLRLKLLAGEYPASCARCGHKELSHYPGTSLNYVFDKDVTSAERLEIVSNTAPDGSYPFRPTHLELKQDHCNFACRMCWEGSSTTIQGERKFLYLSNEHLQHNQPFNLPDSALAGIREVVWQGGEPFMMPVHWELMERLAKLPNKPKIKYITNLSFPGKSFNRAVDLLKNFPVVWMQASVDAFGDRGEYLRVGFNQEEFDTRFNQLPHVLPQVELSFGMTATNVGIASWPEMMRYVTSRGHWAVLRYLSPSNHSRFLHHFSLRLDYVEPILQELLVAAKKTRAEKATDRFVQSFLKDYQPVLLTDADKHHMRVKELTRGGIGSFNKFTQGTLVDEEYIEQWKANR